MEISEEEVERQIGEAEEVETHRRRPPLVREELGLLLGDKGFPGDIIGVIIKMRFVRISIDFEEEESSGIRGVTWIFILQWGGLCDDKNHVIVIVIVMTMIMILVTMLTRFTIGWQGVPLLLATIELSSSFCMITIVIFYINTNNFHIFL